MNNKKIWISKEILSWERHEDTSTIIPRDVALSCYKLWEHADSQTKSVNSFHLQDSIKNLKLVVDRRIKKIETIYNFRQFKRKTSNHTLGIYKQLGLVKGSILEKLFAIRNGIEHHGRGLGISDQDRCMDLSDAVWYFLRSTDFLLFSSPSTIGFENECDTAQGGSIDVENIALKGGFTIWCWLSDSLVSDSKIIGYFEAEIIRHETIEEAKRRIDRFDDYHKDKMNRTDLGIYDIVVVDAEIKESIVKNYIINR